MERSEEDDFESLTIVNALADTADQSNSMFVNTSDNSERGKVLITEGRC